GTIREAKFRSDGCGYMIAAAEAVADGVAGIRLTELHGVDGSLVFAATGEIPESRRHCAATAMDALRQALAKYRQKQIEEFRGEKALVCTCFGITEDDLTAVIERERPEGLEELARFTNAGSGCGSCRMLLQEMIDSSDGHENAV
ncbi:MAG: (2Fe-2S)-binding protein, partial [Pyrinomonadaceae bacterium]|nr:(2Fe-2S)-binding protein [Pyrinomonadaceae bacterium]